jgi:hypothetical protein
VAFFYMAMRTAMYLSFLKERKYLGIPSSDIERIKSLLTMEIILAFFWPIIAVMILLIGICLYDKYVIMFIIFLSIVFSSQIVRFERILEEYYELFKKSIS